MATPASVAIVLSLVVTPTPSPSIHCSIEGLFALLGCRQPNIDLLYDKLWKTFYRDGKSVTDIQTIAVVGYSACSEQDTITPLEIFRGAGMVLSGQIAPLPRSDPPRQLDVKLVAMDPGNIKMQMGTEVVPDAVLGEYDFYDLLYVPGGIGSGEMTLDERLLGAIRRHYAAGKVIAANCSGVGILFRAGILGDHPVTCVAAVARRMSDQGANVPQPRRMWEGLPEARLWTTTGSYGVNGSTVALVAHYFGQEVGTIVSMMFDTLGGIGQDAFGDQGPEFLYHPELEAKFQDYFEPMLMPEPEPAGQR